jgi:hypothetical protein
MKEAIRNEAALEIIKYLEENTKNELEKLTVIMTVLTVFWTTCDPSLDLLFNGIEEKVRKMVRARREDLQKK